MLVDHNQFHSFLNSRQTAEPVNVFLFFGDPWLVRRACMQARDFIVAMPGGRTGIETFQGDDIDMEIILESLNTLPFLYARKLIIIKDMPLFDPGGLPAGQVDAFVRNLETPMPQGHYLLIQSTKVDKRKQAYKIIEKSGLAVDCTIPEGSRQKDIQDKTAVFRTLVNQALERAGKSIEEPAFRLLLDRAGFELDTVLHNVEKLVCLDHRDHVIRPEHVTAVVKRTRKDPIFDLTNAVMDRNLSASLFLMDAMLSEGFHPLQLLSALTGQFRKLLLVKTFLGHQDKKQSRVWEKTMKFPQFKDITMPHVIKHDEKFRSRLKQSMDDTGGEKSLSSDLFLATQPKNAYPVFQTFLKSEKFTPMELVSIMGGLSDLDYRIKTSGTRADDALKHFILSVCLPEGMTQ